MRNTLWITPVLLLSAAIGAPNAQADIVTLNVSGSLSPFGIASCAPSPCLLGGDIVINNTTGAIMSADVTMSGASPAVGPFTQVTLIGSSGAFTGIGLTDAFNVAHSVFDISTPTLGSLVGYAGGPLAPDPSGINVQIIVTFPNGIANWVLINGALTPAVATPEPSSVVLMLPGLGLVLLLRKRNSRGHQLAT